MRRDAWTPRDIPDLEGRRVLITGANAGIGFETARVLASRRATVVLAGRDQDKLDDAAARISSETPAAVVSTAVIDLGDLSSLRTAADELVSHGPLHLLINNAGVMNLPERTTTVDGFERTFGTNHLGHFALTGRLMPALLEARAARIVTVSAIAARWRMGRLDDLMSEQRYRPMGAYAKSKRANVVFTLELARRLEGTDTMPVVVHPGAAMTSLQRHGTGPLNTVVNVVAGRMLMGSPEGAAWPSLYAATSPAVKAGQFIGPAGRKQDSGPPKPVRLPRGADDADEARRLWEQSEALTGVRFALEAVATQPRPR